MSNLEKAAQAVLVRWDSPAWDWAHQGPTAALMADLRRALAAHKEQAEPVADDCTPNHFCGSRWIHKPADEICNRCGHNA
jgi:hypothetical protein